MNYKQMRRALQANKAGTKSGRAEKGGGVFKGQIEEYLGCRTEGETGSLKKGSYRGQQGPEREGARIPDRRIRTQHKTWESQDQPSGRGLTVSCLFQKDHPHCHVASRFSWERLEAGRPAGSWVARRGIGRSNSIPDDGSRCLS